MIPHAGDVDRLVADGWLVETISIGGGSNRGGPGPDDPHAESSLDVISAERPGSVLGTLIGLHGGGYVVCSARTHVARFARMAPAGWRVVVPDYRLAPESPCPAAIDDAVATIGWARSQWGPDHRVVLVGDSAGAGLVLATLRAMSDGSSAATDGGVRTVDAAEPTNISAAVCISPWVDGTCSLQSHRTRRDVDPFAHLDDLPAYAAAYAGTLPVTDPRVSPLFGDLSGLPPLLIQVGTDETLLDDARALATEVHHAGGNVRLEEWEQMFHTWHGHHGRLTGSDLACDAIGHFIQTATEAP